MLKTSYVFPLEFFSIQFCFQVLQSQFSFLLGPFRPTAQAFTANEAMFGYTQPGFVSTRPSVVGHGVNNFFNNFVTARPGNWFDSKNSTFNIGDSQTKFGLLLFWHLLLSSTFFTDWRKSEESKYNFVFGFAGTNIQFKPRVASEIPNNRLVRYQTISIMPEYSDKSLEELRLEDYVANRQHVQQVQKFWMRNTIKFWIGFIDFCSTQQPWLMS